MCGGSGGKAEPYVVVRSAKAWCGGHRGGCRGTDQTSWGLCTTKQVGVYGEGSGLAGVVVGDGWWRWAYTKGARTRALGQWPGIEPDVVLGAGIKCNGENLRIA